MSAFEQILVAAASIAIGGFFLTGGRWRFIYVLYKTAPRDILGAIRFIRVNILLWWWETRGFTVARVFSRLTERHPEKVAYIFEDKEWTYRQLDEFSNRIGSYFHTRSLSRGDSIALVMEGRPEYIGTWLGLSKVGFVGALINTNLRQEVLIHSIKTANCKALIFGSELKDAVRDIKDKLPELMLFQWSEHEDVSILEGAIDLNKEILSLDPEPPLKEMALGTPRDKLIYIYTSGTTGMPKAAVINNLRYMLMAYGVYSMLALRSDDRIYNSLPLYHTAGGIIGAGQPLLTGITVVLRRRFSASKFWSDCVHYECTIAQYIGEICRYLLTVPPSSYDTSHKVRLMYGNGLRPQIWKPFVERFGVKQIGEFYGATEGNSNLVNIDNRVGAVGFVPRFAGNLYPVTLLRVDEETGEPIRGPEGFCVPCKPGEPGVFVGKINPRKAVNDFSGYADKKASEQKIIRDVFKKGDRVFNTGDILVMDELGYFYFKDRTGDTFRWRGENVATSEVEAVVSNVIGLKDTVVYGVEVPGNEGKAGMAAIYDPEGSLNLKELADGVKKVLPIYARPLFVRVLSKLPMTGTYKLKKKDLQSEGFDITKFVDPIYFLDRTGTYVKLTDDLYKNILEEKVRI
ncbi:PREDICTED: long-chain fatty acid transport protein 4-like [Polistes dominula]|uniref:Long-chain-fatty-acid--CoA ligase n=1 Tax=Polistes dominula TaxID=743375 RepID=A0ABM1HY41_POLDO|nr:PREDICTED: long-chain fatty acid transport protein 4-like [Polistes dominula]